ncbi:MAG TPA: polysaccharide deacetylase family protein [Solirubrobacteraceae bacterium]|nr:polysaccharide deacetylase family protein [Solirubrobacteraceae bacterium]
MRLRLLIPAAAAALGISAGPAVAASPTPPPGRAGVRSASLVQSGRSLTWTVTLVHGISPAGVASGARRVCLELQDPRTHATLRSICLDASRGHPRLGLVRILVRHRRIATVALPGSVARSQAAHTITASFSPVSLGLAYRSLRWQVTGAARGRTCPVSIASGGTRAHLCTVTFPARRHPLVAMHTPQLVGCVPAGPSLVYSGPPSGRDLALAFDDGPWPDPPSIEFVNELKRLGVVATFFEIGSQISEYDSSGAVERAMLADGDMIGNHTWTHPDMLTLSAAQQAAQLEQTNAAIRRQTGFTPCLWRPPYGATSPALQSLARSLGMLTIQWNIDPRDWSLPGTGAIVATVLREAQNGGITVMHFGGGPREETLAALPKIVAGLRARGYRFVNLAQMLGLREIWR